jgi:hypothetical protein
LAETINACLEKEHQRRIGVVELQQRLSRLSTRLGEQGAPNAGTTSGTRQGRTASPQLANTIAEHFETRGFIDLANANRDTLMSPTDHTATKPHVDIAGKPTAFRSLAFGLACLGVLASVAGFGLANLDGALPQLSDGRVTNGLEPVGGHDSMQPILVADSGTTSDAGAYVESPIVSSHLPGSFVESAATFIPSGPGLPQSLAPSPARSQAATSGARIVTVASTTVPASTNDGPSAPRVRRLDKTIRW